MPESILPEDIKNIVIFRTDRIGEVLLSTVCIDALKRHFPQSHITFVTSHYAKDTVSGRDNIDEVFIFDTITKGNSFLKLIKLLSYLRKRRFDLAVVLNPHKILHLSCFLAGIKYRLGYDRKWPFCLTHKIEDRKHECKKHEIGYNLDLLKIIGVEEQIVPPHLAIFKEDLDYIDRLIKQTGLDNGKPIVSIHPGSSNPAKRWPKENFSLMIEKVKANLDCNVVLLGGKEDKKLVLDILSGCDQAALDLSSAFTIKQLAAFLKKCTLFIGNDAGPMHIAAAVGTSVIALFGKASSPTRWRPWGEGHIVLRKNNINEITVDEVFVCLQERLSKIAKTTAKK